MDGDETGTIVDERPASGSDQERVVAFTLDAGKRAALARAGQSAAALTTGLAHLRASTDDTETLARTSDKCEDGDHGDCSFPKCTCSCHEDKGKDSAETVTASADDHDHADGSACACGGECDTCKANASVTAAATDTAEVEPSPDMTEAAAPAVTIGDATVGDDGTVTSTLTLDGCSCPTFSGLSGHGTCATCGGMVTPERLLHAITHPGEQLRSETAARLAASRSDFSPIDQNNPGKFNAVLVTENEKTADNRLIEKGATGWRDTPLPLMLMTQTADGHDGAVVCAVIDKISRSGAVIKAAGHFDTSTDGAEGARLVRDRVLTSVSIDGGDLEYDLEITTDDNGNESYLFRITKITILGATIVPFPAIGSATIDYLAAAATGRMVLQGTIEFVEDNDVEPLTLEGKVDALLAAGPRQYDPALFNNPQFSGPTPIRVHPASADGTHRITGHLALWGECHVGIAGVCTKPPRSHRDYLDFMTGEVHLSNGEYQPVGRITLSSIAGHAPQDMTAQEAMAHYDNTGLQAAYVAAGEDAHGIWVSGVLSPNITEEKATILAASSLSGDWRKRGGHLELIGALAVNVPGFPVIHAKGGEQLSLVAAGYGPQTHEREHILARLDDRDAHIDARLAEQAEQLQALHEAFDGFRARMAPVVRDAIRARLAASARTQATVEDTTSDGEATGASPDLAAAATE